MHREREELLQLREAGWGGEGGGWHFLFGEFRILVRIM